MKPPPRRSVESIQPNDPAHRPTLHEGQPGYRPNELHFAEVVPPPEAEKKLEDGTDVGIECSECGRPMKVRTNGDNGSRFLGCSGYPVCRTTSEIPTYHRMVAAGAQRLPGFD